MDNQTDPNVFHIVAFSNLPEKQTLLFVLFLFIYLTGVLGNLLIITVVCMDTHLHTPMYIFLGNLSFVDISFTTITLPKLLDILISGNDSVSVIQCYTQLYFFSFIVSTEVVLLSCMAYDRYVAICSPLHYHLIMNKKKCILFLGSTWIFGSVNSGFHIILVLNVTICHSNEIHQFFCDMKSIEKLSCDDLRFHSILFVETLLFGLFPFLFNLMSYVKIIHSILCMKSMDSRRKAFSTCSSHLTVLSIFYITGLCQYMKAPAAHSGELDQMLSVLYSAVTPMINPLIYSLKNKEVKCALKKILSLKAKH